jgi:hypothetical protein
VVIDPKDIELKTARSGGAGGNDLHIVLCIVFFFDKEILLNQDCHELQLS